MRAVHSWPHAGHLNIVGFISSTMATGCLHFGKTRPVYLGRDVIGGAAVVAARLRRLGAKRPSGPNQSHRASAPI